MRRPPPNTVLINDAGELWLVVSILGPPNCRVLRCLPYRRQGGEVLLWPVRGRFTDGMRTYKVLRRH